VKARPTNRTDAAALVLFVVLAGCTKKESASQSPAATATTTLAIRPVASVGSPRPGMTWVPPGKLVAGTPVGKTPRIAEEELPGKEIEMRGFYIDLYPHPNEAGAIPTTSVSQADAAKQCEAKGKRLCTELEWERACKGPDNTAYEYGDAYKAQTCGTGVAAEQAARSPIGEHVGCKSGFGALEMHGGVWEWTQSRWARGAGDRDLAVLKGGNAVAGEIVGRCANASARAPSAKGATMGFRCCAGEKNEAEVVLPATNLPAWERMKDPGKVAAQLGVPALRAWGIDEHTFYNYPGAWTWRPVANEEIVVLVGCSPIDSPPHCEVAALRAGPKPVVLAHYKVGAIQPSWEMPPNDPRSLRGRGFRPAGAYFTELRYAYGRVDLHELKP
jgi:formylglycine-generating enzyme required for sulfatase activity